MEHKMMHASEEEWDVQQDAVIFFSHLMRLRSQIDRKSFADKTGRVVKSTSLRLGSIMKRAHCAKQLEFSHEAVSLPQLFHFNKRLAHVFLALLGRDLRKLHYKMHPSTQPPCFSSVSEAEIYPPLHNRTDEYTEVTLDAPTIDAVSRSECALGVKDLFYDAQVENSMVGGGLPPDGASAADIYGSGTFKISIQELKRVSKSARVAVGSVLPPAFLEGLVWAMCGTGAAHGRDFFSLRRNIPLKEICCENRINALKQFHFDVLCSAEMHLATLNAANNAEAKTADTLEGTALRSAIFTAEENLKQSERNVASLDNLKQNNALEYEVDNFLKKVKHDPVAYGFPCASKVNECITRPLSVLCESMCTSTEGYSFVDGCSQRYNQIIAKTPESFALFGVSRLADTQCASVDIVSLRVRLRIQYRLLMNLAKFHKVEYISSVVTFAEPPFGVSMSSLREASLKALLDVLCSDGGGSHNASTPFLHLQCWYLYCESEAAKLECQTILDRHKSQSSKQLRANIILHERDPKFLAVELCKRGCATALIYGTDINELLLGHPGGSWEEGRGNSGFGLKEDIAATTTLLLNSSAIVGREHFLAERILYEDTEGWNETRLSDITERISFEEKQQQQQQQRLQPKTQPEQKPKPAASVATPTPAPTATMVSLTYQEESCIVEVSSLTDALSIARESFEALSAIDEALFYLAYFYGEKRRGIKSDRHFNTFVSLALKSAVRMDGDIPELEVVQRKRAKQNSKSEKHSKEKPERQKRAKEVAAPPEEVEEVNTEAVPPPPPALPIPQTAPPDPEEAKQEVKKCKGRLSELLKEQEEFEELKEWKKEHAEVEIRAVVGANAPILKKTIVLNRRELSSLDTLIPVIHGEISYNPDIFFYERGDMVAITSDAILQTFIAERWDCLLFFTKPKRLVSLRPLKPTPDEESAIITMTFNPPTLRVVGCVEQCTVYAISDTVATVLAPTALHGCVGGGIRKGRAKRKVELHFEALPQPHWGATYSNIFCDQTTQSVLFSSVLDAMYDTGGWVMNDTSSCTCPVEVPRSCTAADPPAMPVMVDFYKFFFSRDIRQAAKRKMHKIEAEQQQAEEFLRRIHAIHEADAAERSDIYSLERDAYKSITTEEHIRILDVQRALHVARHKEQMRLVESRRKQDAKIKIRLRLEEDQAAAAAAAQQREPPILYNSGVQGYGQVVLAGGGGGGVPVEEVEAAAPTPTPPLERRSSQAEVLKYSTRVRKKSAGSVGLQVWSSMTWEQRLSFLQELGEEGQPNVLSESYGGGDAEVESPQKFRAPSPTANIQHQSSTRVIRRRRSHSLGEIPFPDT